MLWVCFGWVGGWRCLLFGVVLGGWWLLLFGVDLWWGGFVGCVGCLVLGLLECLNWWFG